MTKRILLGVTGSIAAYKAAEFVRLLKKANYDVRVVMTLGAQEFVTPMCFEVLSGHPVYTDVFDKTEPMIHIELAKWADLIVIAPASADSIARLAHGFANDLLSTLCLAAVAPMVIVPAMNQHMWHHAATQKNVALLQKNGVCILPTEFGVQACGDMGLGRMLDPTVLMTHIKNFFQDNHASGIHVLITAGPTQEAIDPVRYLTNYSSGKMAYALAEAFQEKGAHVILISGPTSLSKPHVAQFISVITADEMCRAVMKYVKSCTLFIAAAAVADFKIKKTAAQKIKKTSGITTLELLPNEDILKKVGGQKKRPFIVGFAAETEHLLVNAKKKLLEKNCDLLVANQITQEGPFDSETNKIWLLERNKENIEFPERTKKQLAEDLYQVIVERLKISS